MAVVLDPKQLDSKERGPRTYALKIEVLQLQEGLAVATFYKFGLTNLSVASRFRSESPLLRIEILRIWRHQTLQEARDHENKLFKKYRPTCLFDGWESCPKDNGPLCSAKGNTELFLANRFEGEKDIKLPYALMWMNSGGCTNHFVFHRQYVPDEMPVYTGSGLPDWLSWLRDVPYDYFLLPTESGKKGRLIFVRDEYLFDAEYFGSSARKRDEFKEQAVQVETFEQARRLSGVWD